MNYTVRDAAGVREVELNGQLTFDANDDFRVIIDAFKTDGIAECVLNMGNLDFIDSAGLGLLVLANNAANRSDVRLKLKHPKGQVREMIEISEFHTIIPCEF